MTAYVVLGTRAFQYKRKSDGNLVSALEIHASYTPDSREGESRNGDFVERFFVPMDKVTVIPSVGDVVEIWYNRFGSVDGYRIV